MDTEVEKYARFLQWTLMAAEFHALLGDAGRSIEWLELAVRNGDERAQWFAHDPLLANVHSHPRFRQILSVLAQRRAASGAGQAP